MKKILYYLFLLFIFVEVVYAEPTKLYDIMKNNAVADNKSSQYVNGTSGVDFSLGSSGTNGMGIYQLSSTANDEYPIYYYRGNIYNNNVVIGDYCWLILRTAENGSVKLLYNGLYKNGGCGTDDKYNRVIASQPYNTDADFIESFGYMYTESYPYLQMKRSDLINVVYGNSVEYKNGKYTLIDTYTAASFDKNVQEKYHYSCFTNDVSCEEVNYIYSSRESTNIFYITLTNGELTEDFLNKYVVKSTNEKDSNIKLIIDDWYKNNFSQYEKYLEDVVYCNDRRIYDLGGWDKDGNLYTGSFESLPLLMKGYERIYYGPNYGVDLSCDLNDSFTVSEKNGNGKLTFPIATITADEIVLSGGVSKQGSGSSISFLQNVSNIWTMTPFDFLGYGYGASIFYLNSYNAVPHQTRVENYYGIAPVIALNNDVFVEGNGNPDNPYKIVDMYKVEYLVDDTVLEDYEKKDYYYPLDEVVVDYLEIGKEYDGYVFKGWKTTDVVVTDNKFLMPDNHVYLVPLLEKIEETTEEIIEDTSNDKELEQEKNPETSDLIIMVLIVFVCSIVFIYSYRIQKEN